MLFEYKAVDQNGKETVGTIDAFNRVNAISTLQSQGQTILRLKPKSGSIFEIKLFQRVKTKDMVLFSRQIATLFEANVSALRAFNIVSAHINNKYFKEILEDIAQLIEQGSSLENAFRKHKNVFGEFFINIVAVGEQSGTLPRSFTYLAEYVDKAHQLQTKVRRALSYPIFVVIVFVAVIVLMMVTVIPQISGILLQSGQDLPLITKFVIASSDFLRNNIYIILVGVAGIIAGMVLYGRTEEGKRTYDSFVITIPFIGRLLKEFYLVRFAENLSVMLASSAPIVSALETISAVIGNEVYKENMKGVATKVRQGANLSSAIGSTNLFDKSVEQIVLVGEETGQLANMLKALGNFYQQKLEDTIATFIDLIQPTVIVILGVVVGLIISSVILPIYSLSTAI